MMEKEKIINLLEDIKKEIVLNKKEQMRVIKNIKESVNQIDMDSLENAAWEMRCWTDWIEKINLIEAQTDQLLRVARRLQKDINE